MTASGAERHPWRNVLAWRIAHATPVFWLFCLTWLLVRDFATERLLVRVVLTVPFLLVTLVTAIANAWHEKILCVPCGERTPEDWARSTRRVRPLLWLYHHRVAACVALVLISLMLQILLTRIVAVAINNGMLFFIALAAQSVLTHRVHLPWCTYCGDGWEGGGGKEAAPEPLPVSPPTGKRG